MMVALSDVWLLSAGREMMDDCMRYASCINCQPAAAADVVMMMMMLLVQR